jgi:hypothetical protein
MKAEQIVTILLDDEERWYYARVGNQRVRKPVPTDYKQKTPAQLKKATEKSRDYVKRLVATKKG